MRRIAESVSPRLGGLRRPRAWRAVLWAAASQRDETRQILNSVSAAGPAPGARGLRYAETRASPQADGPGIRGERMEAHGSVLGIDVGWSTKRRSSAVCRLHWSCSEVAWEFGRFRATDEERKKAIQQVDANHELMAVAIDGPLRRGFAEIGRYRRGAPANSFAAQDWASSPSPGASGASPGAGTHRRSRQAGSSSWT